MKGLKEMKEIKGKMIYIIKETVCVWKCIAMIQSFFIDKGCEDEKVKHPGKEDDKRGWFWSHSIIKVFLLNYLNINQLQSNTFSVSFTFEFV